MPVDPQDGGLDDWIESAPALIRFLPSNAPVFDAQDGGVNDWVAPSAPVMTSGRQRAAVTGFDVQDGGPDDWIPHAPVLARFATLGHQINDSQPSDLDDWIPHAPILARPGQKFPTRDPQDGGIDDWVAPSSAPGPVDGQDLGAMRTDPSDGGPDDWIAPWTQPAGQSRPAQAISNQARGAPELWRPQNSLGPGQMVGRLPNRSMPEGDDHRSPHHAQGSWLVWRVCRLAALFEFAIRTR